MNKVYLSGMVFEEPKLINKPEGEAHLVFPLMVRHKAKAGVRAELYRISAWNKCATFLSVNLKKGMKVALQGYLSQRPVQMADKVFNAAEVTANEVFFEAGQSAACEQARGEELIDENDAPVNKSATCALDKTKEE